MSSRFSRNITRKGGETGQIRNVPGPAGRTDQSSLRLHLFTHLRQEFGKVKQSYYLNTCLQLWEWRPP